MTRRILAFLAGAALLALIAVASVGSVLAAPIGMWITSIVQRARGRRYTRAASWLGAVGGCALVFAGFLTFAIVRLPDGFVESVRQKTAERQAEPTVIERTFQRAARSTATQAAVQRKTEEFARSKAFIWWVTVVGGIMSAGLVGLLLGSVGWAGTALMSFGITGRTPGSSG